MAYFAKMVLNGQSKYEVEHISCVADSVAPTEQAGIDFLNDLHNTTTHVSSFYKQSFTNQQILDNPEGKRKNPAMSGGLYDADADAFIPPKPFKSWILNETTYQWNAPTPMPDNGTNYWWNEETLSWTEFA
jgi:hypothetical protein